ncbi:MAG: hypothetical protein HOO96_00290 [Polyangiaceae bacterium]|nr:hypothetical protein [Polyangiaceae bacterium]
MTFPHVCRVLHLVALLSLTGLGCASSGPSPSDAGGCGPSTSDGGDSGSIDVGAEPSCAENEPNDTRETATKLALNMDLRKRCLGAAADVDFYEVVVPKTAYTGYLHVHLRNVGGTAGDTTIGLTVYSAADNGRITSQRADRAGADLDVYWSTAAGQTYRMQVDGVATAYPARYDIEAEFVERIDTFEPNDDRSVAKTFVLGQKVEGAMLYGHRSQSLDSADGDDWFAIQLAAGSVSVDIPGVEGVSLTASLFDPQGTYVASASSTGNDIALRTSLPTPGRCFIQLSTNDRSGYGAGKKVPSFFSASYAMTVTQ